ncbi:hypothetical protein MCSV2_40155 [Mucispirillum schaedleri ASF457]|nr:hypothetical protein MCSV2_40155 [Mucispirillum schaedleri ASF457]
MDKFSILSILYFQILSSYGLLIPSLLARKVLASQKRGLAHVNGKLFSILGAERSKRCSP